MPPIGAPLATDDLAFPATLADAGFAVIPDVLPPSLVESARTAADALIAASVTEGKISAGVRWAVDRSPSLAATLQSSEIAALIDTLASGRRVWLVRSILFDKTAASNWLVPWHQDTTISVRSRIDTPGFTSWCERDGRLQCDPPAAILDDMFTLRIHLDDCGADNGALSVIPGSHRHGVLAETQVEQLTASAAPILCEVPAGGVMVMKPLLLHRSSKSTQPSRRRVLHIELATCELPGGLRWHADQPLSPRA